MPSRYFWMSYLNPNQALNMLFSCKQFTPTIPRSSYESHNLRVPLPFISTASQQELLSNKLTIRENMQLYSHLSTEYCLMRLKGRRLLSFWYLTQKQKNSDAKMWYKVIGWLHVVIQVDYHVMTNWRGTWNHHYDDRFLMMILSNMMKKIKMHKTTIVYTLYNSSDNPIIDNSGTSKFWRKMRKGLSLKLTL